MGFKKYLISLVIISLIVLPVCYASLDSGLQAPEGFEKADNWDKAVYDIYDLKTDKNTELYIINYTDDDYNLFFKDDAQNKYSVSNYDNNTVIGTDKDLNDGYLLEIVEYDGNKYIVYTYLKDNPTNDNIKDSIQYLTEFNKLNKLEPIAV